MKNSFLTSLLFAFALLACKPVQKTATTITPQATTPGYTLQETYWKLTELMGKPIVKDEKMSKEIHIILKNEDNRVQGFSGCNTLMGKYEIKEGNRISFSGIASTMMACPHMKTETEFNKMLTSVDNYSINGNILTLNNARMAPMARFEAMVMK